MNAGHRNRSTVFILALMSLGALSLYGFWSRGLWRQRIWESPGPERFLIFLAVAFFWSAGWILLRPEWFAPATVAAVMIYSIAAVGVWPIVAAGLFLFACFVLGRILFRSSGLVAMLAGMSVVIAAVN